MWSWNGSSVQWLNSLSVDKNQKMLKKWHEKKDEEDRRSIKQINVCNALFDNKINAWISCEQVTEKLKDISVEKKPAVVVAQIEF